MKNHYFQKIVVFFLSFLLLSKNVFAEIVDVTSDKYILYNMNETEVLSEKNSHEKAYVASLTKLMTVLVAVENIDDYKNWAYMLVISFINLVFLLALKESK